MMSGVILQNLAPKKYWSKIFMMNGEKNQHLTICCTQEIPLLVKTPIDSPKPLFMSKLKFKHFNFIFLNYKQHSPTHKKIYYIFPEKIFEKKMFENFGKNFSSFSTKMRRRKM
jgi:hypothetical protein